MIPDGGVPLVPECPGMGKKAVRVDRRLPVLGCDDDGGRIEEVISLSA